MIVAFIVIRQSDAPDSFVATDMNNCVSTKTQDELLDLLCQPRKTGCEFRVFELTHKICAENYCARMLLNIPRELQNRPVLYPVFTELWNFLNR